MKFFIDEETYEVYVNNIIANKYDVKSEKELEKLLKKIFLEIKDRFDKVLNGLYDVKIVVDKNAGFNIKIKRIDTFISIKDVDLKIKIIYDDNFYCKSKEFEAFLGLKGIYYCDDFYYIKVSNIDDLNKCIEFVDIIYDEKFKNKKNLVRVT